VPTLVIFFNRPKILVHQIISLKKNKPRDMYFAADGPRQNTFSDIYNLKECKKIVSEMVDWDCDLHFLYEEINYGCDYFVPKAIDWFFSNVDCGIILEDDCLISSDFYRFSGELLERYRDNDRVMNISSANFQIKSWGEADYYYSAYPANWGWATWARAWKKFSPDMSGLNQFLSNEDLFEKIVPNPNHRKFWTYFFEGLKSGKYTFWDAKWVYSIWKNDGVSIAPNINMVSNIGYGDSATHTKNKDAGMDRAYGILGELILHPPDKIQVCYEADLFLFKTRYKPTIKGRFQKLLKMIFRT